jgi:hypothetical protein
MLSSVCQKWPSDRSGSAGNRGDCSVSYTTRWDTILAELRPCLRSPLWCTAFHPVCDPVKAVYLERSKVRSFKCTMALGLVITEPEIRHSWRVEEG